MELKVALALSCLAVACRRPAPAPAPQPLPRTGGTRQTAALAALGLDARDLPELSAVDARTMKPLMDTFDDSLDACCEDCHVKNDPKAPTDAKRIASEMWRRYSRDLVTIDGAPVYCDSCHEGRLRFLDRSDPKALSQWMLANYVRKLRRKDGSRVECSTCHGRPFEPRILENLWHARKG